MSEAEQNVSRSKMGLLVVIERAWRARIFNSRHDGGEKREERASEADARIGLMPELRMTGGAVPREGSASLAVRVAGFYGERWNEEIGSEPELGCK